ncbi:MAG TPA: hypothetical protein PLA46_09595 [Phycicoccus sp.]|nr:hypothetical protein [Phycicoccus sp.]HRA44513.1 hypothetical protein [Phycicoccus sp.]
MGNFRIVMSAMHYAHELWRYGEGELAGRAALMTAGECLDVGQRAGDLAMEGGADELWPDGPRGYPRARLLAVIEHLEGAARPASRTRRLPEKSIPSELLLDPEAQAAQTEALRAEWIARQLC